MKADALTGLAVVAMAEGTKLGRVDDVLIGTEGLRLVALLIGGAGQAGAIPFEDIERIGPDAVIVATGRVVRAINAGDAFSKLPGLNALKKLRVVDATGTLVGTVGGVEFDPATGRVLSLTVQKGGVMGLGVTTTAVSADAIRSVGPELITLGTDAGAAAPA